MPGPKDERPLTAEEQRFIRKYCDPDCRDVDRAAKLARCKVGGKAMYKRPAVRADIERRLRVVELEQTRLDVINEVLTDRFIDETLVETLKLDPKEHGSTRLAALTLAYVVKGRIETRNAKAVTRDGGGKSAFGPTIYGSVGSINPSYTVPAPGQATTTLRRTEEVIQTHPQPEAAAAALPAPAHVFEVIER